ncbi:ABC transporter ATP-binding protein [Pseudorhodoferax soli]|uniref:Amino acid/amide ABC transporter ATP-binding protein 1 (HAAT family) n=1 Tax=Pseudorhodoferax soli TaxID=545864 RepID=A0A368Y4Q9_9BURK|nr:ABC transporter ATP-binding protein [Pseudorhodoferax soli]RCW74308.1 amino acid/amide ABC transporter ATP-binding protein 1 (HAAT family) [Pseudorhodoferax soli]
MTALLSTQGLSLSFGAVVACDAIDFSLQRGERLAVVGQNGAGKTTFLNIVTGYLKPSAGSVHFDGADISGLAPRAITLRGIGRSFQLPQLFTEHTVRECLLLAASARAPRRGWWPPLAQAVDAERVDATLALLQLAPRAHDLAGALPEGQRKLLDVAMALILEPKLLIMDEPTSGVSTDEKHGLMQVLMRALDARQVSCIFVEHDIDIVRAHATRLCAWIAGRIAADGPPAQVLADPIVVKNVIGE